MGLFDKLFSSKQTSAQSETAVMESPPCPHGILTARWDSAADMGHEDRATEYVCASCNETFSPEEARALRAAIGEKMIELTSEAEETPTPAS